MIYLINEITKTLFGDRIKTVQMCNNASEAVIFMTKYVNGKKNNGKIEIQKVQV